MTNKSPLDMLAGSAFQQVVREVMREVGVNPEQMRERSGLSLSHLRFILHGKDGVPIIPQIGTFIAVALGLDVPATTLMERTVREIERMATANEAGAGAIQRRVP